MAGVCRQLVTSHFEGGFPLGKEPSSNVSHMLKVFRLDRDKIQGDSLQSSQSEKYLNHNLPLQASPEFVAQFVAWSLQPFPNCPGIRGPKADFTLPTNQPF